MSEQSNGQTTALQTTARVNTVFQMNENDLVRASEMIFKSNVFGDIKSKEAAAIKIWAGDEYGFKPLQSMSMTDFIQGRPTLNAHGKATLINSSGDYRLKINELTNFVCSIDVCRKNDQGQWRVIGTRTFTMEDAAQAGLTTGNNAHSWKKYPRNMLYARCVSNIWRWDCAELNTRNWKGTQIVEFIEPELEAEAEVAPPMTHTNYVDAESVETVETPADAGNEPQNDAEAVDMQTGEEIQVEAMSPDESRLVDLQLAVNDLLDQKIGKDEHERKKFLKGKVVANESLESLQKIHDDLFVL